MALGDERGKAFTTHFILYARSEHPELSAQRSALSRIFEVIGKQQE